MAKDWSSKQPAPQSRTAPLVTTEKEQAGTPVTGFDNAPSVGLPATGPGKGIPASNRKMR